MCLNHWEYALLFCTSRGCRSKTRATQYGRIFPVLVSLCHEEQDKPVTCDSWRNDFAGEARNHCHTSCEVLPGTACQPSLSLQVSFSLQFWEHLLDIALWWCCGKDTDSESRLAWFDRFCNPVQVTRKLLCYVVYVVSLHNTWNHRPKLTEHAGTW